MNDIEIGITFLQQKFNGAIFIFYKGLQNMTRFYGWVTIIKSQLLCLLLIRRNLWLRIDSLLLTGLARRAELKLGT